MPAWMAGIQVRQDASGNVHVNLDSSTPYWNDAIEGFYLNPDSAVAIDRGSRGATLALQSRQVSASEQISISGALVGSLSLTATT
jgi:hypothetical protein